MAYNPYNAVNAIYNLKNEWAKADKSGDTKARDKAAENAKVYYNQLKNNRYGATADELSALDANGAKYILDQYSTKNSGVDNQAYSTTMQGAVDKNNVFAGYIDSDRKDVQGKYNDIYNYANQDITKTDEYKSTYNSIMGKYDMSALQGRDNAAASGGASNGGNIDSYAAANAMRQQAALTATGQQIAHQAGLEAANARVSNVSNILNNLGVYNSGTYDAMNQTVNNDLNIANSYFTNAETAKNNEAKRQQIYSDISGTVGDTVIKYLNSNTWNADGSLVNYGQNFQASIDELEKTLDATTDPAERAKITEQLRVLEMARNQKIDEQGLTYGKTYKYQSKQQTEAGKQFDKTMDYNYKALETGSSDTRYGIDKDAEMQKYGVDAQVQMNSDNNQTALNTSLNKSSGSPGVGSKSSSGPSSSGGDDLLGGDGEDADWKDFYNSFSKKSIKTFLDDVIKNIYYMAGTGKYKRDVLEEKLKTAILNNTAQYDIDVEDARRILNKFDVDATWLNAYENYWRIDPREGMHIK